MTINRIRLGPFGSFLSFGAVALLVAGSAVAQAVDVWIGTGGADGIHYLNLDSSKGTMTDPVIAAEIDGSGFLAMHPTGDYLYSTRLESGAGFVSAFRIDKNRGKTPLLELINSQPIGDGGAACIAVDKTGRVLMSAQYGGGSVATFPINDDGSIGPRVELVKHGQGSGVVANRQAESHPHWVGTSPDNRFMLVPDLGMDRVVVYELDAETAKLKPHSQVAVPPGAGPRHMKFHTSGRYAFVLNEMALTISCFEFDAETGKFSEIQVIETLPASEKDENLDSAAEIRVHPTGKFVYSSNRGHDSISAFSVDPNSGKLSFIEREPVRGSWPRNFNLDASGKWLIAAGKYSNTLALFEVKPDTGELVFTRKIVNSPAPICVLFASD